MITLRLENLVRSISGRTLLDGVTLTFEPGRINLLLGPNGAGKTTLLRVCAGLDTPDGGTIHHQDEGGRQVGPGEVCSTMVFQRPVLFNRSVRANIGYPLQVRGLPASEVSERIEEAMALASLAPLANRNARSLSGGEAQRLALARAFVMRPSLLLLDEPAANLDPESRWRVEKLVLAMREKFGTTVVMTTHDLLQARKMGEMVFFIERGRLSGPWPVRDFFHDPPHPAATRFISGVLHPEG